MITKQLSNEDAVVLEAIIDNSRIIIASMYLDINRQIDMDMLKIEAKTTHAMGASVIIAMDSNSRSTSWHDIPTGEGRWRNF